ncbi:hypothetical protein Tco_1500724 [Tanacetum coccineum]
MSSITAQQAKLDFELVPKEKRLEIGKWNGRLNPGKIQREPTFQVVLDALALTPCYSTFLITADVPEVYMHQFWDSVYKHDTFYKFKMDKRKRFKLTLEIFRDIFKICPRIQGQDFDALPTDEEIVSFLRELGHTGEINSLNDVVVDQMHQPWRTFAALINRSLSRKTTGLNKLRLSIAQILWAVSWRNKIRIHTSKDDYLINTLRFIPAKEATQIYGVVLPESLTSPKMKETKSYKTYLVSPEEPTKKSKRVKRPANKSTKASPGGVVIKETPEMPLSKKKEKMTVEKRKGIDMLSEVALTKEAQYEEATKKSLRDFHKTYPSGSGAIIKTAPSAGNDEDNRNDDHDSSGEDNSEHETDENESGFESDQEENEEDIGDDEEEVKDEFVKTPSNDSEDEDETKITGKAEGDEDEEMDYTTSQLYDDVDIRLNKPIQDDDETKTKVPVTSSSHSSDLASKFLNFLDIPHTNAEIVSAMDVHVHHEVPSQQTPTFLTVPISVITDSSPVYSTVIPQSLPSFTPPPQQSTSTPPPTTKDDPLKTQVTALVDELLDARLGATTDEFMNYLSVSITARITEQVKN